MGGFIQRPAQHRRSLPRKVTRHAALIGLVHGDVQAAVADCVPRGAKPSGVAESSGRGLGSRDLRRHVLPLLVTHELLGRLIRARRPTVPRAIATLESDGAIRRLDDGSWLLNP